MNDSLTAFPTVTLGTVVLVAGAFVVAIVALVILLVRRR